MSRYLNDYTRMQRGKPASWNTGHHRAYMERNLSTKRQKHRLCVIKTQLKKVKQPSDSQRRNKRK